MANKLSYIALALALGASACGKKDKDESEETITGKAAELTTGTLVVNYALTALSSAAINTETSLRLDEGGQSADFPKCNVHGEPWDAETSQRMQPSNPKFAETTFYCQLNFPDSSETVLGTYTQNMRVLCEIERSIPDLTYEAGGKVHSGVSVTFDKTCGWPDTMLEEMGSEAIIATVTATQIDEDYDRSLKIEIPDMVGFTMMWKVSTDEISFKQLDSWSQAERIENGDYNGMIADDATGTRGSVVSLDLKNGVLRAEIADNYWSRRTRMNVKGEFNTDTGKFDSISEGWGLQGSFDISTDENGDPIGLYGEYSTVKGSEAAGFRFNSYRFKCHSPDCDVSADVRTNASIDLDNSSTVCAPAGKTCDGNAGIELEPSEEVYDFLTVGVAWKEQAGTSATYESWIKTAPPLDFEDVTISTVPPSISQ